MWKRSFARSSNLARSPEHSIMVAALMLLYHVIRCKYLLYLKSWFWGNNSSRLVLITLCKVLCHPAHISIKSLGMKNSSAAKKYRLELVKSHWKRSEIYLFSRSLTQTFLRHPTIVADIFENFEQPFKNLLAMPLLCITEIVNNTKLVSWIYCYIQDYIV